MTQMQLFHDSETSISRRIVNVASVPQRSPFRYPGGKTWLVPRIREWLMAQPKRPALVVEPFAGGGIVSLTAVAEDLTDHAVMVELDDDVAAVWSTVITDGDGPRLAERIVGFEFNVENVVADLAHEPLDNFARAWRTILKNRVQRGGILAPGAGLVRNGEGGKGLRSRWYPATLARRICDIHMLRERLTFVHGDGLTVMREHAMYANTCTFIDPPYTAGVSGKRAGSRLYTHNDVDHETLYQMAQAMSGDILLTYDDNAEVRDLARRHGFVTAAIPMKSTHHATMSELLIGRNLDWLL